MTMARREAAACSRGHKMEGDNLYIEKSGKRHCRECRKRSWALQYEARKERRRKANVYGDDVYYDCQQCGRPKFGDKRRLCLTCAAKCSELVVDVDGDDEDFSMAVEMETTLMAHDASMDTDVQLESAPAWVKNGSDDDKRRWLEGRTRRGW